MRTKTTTAITRWLKDISLGAAIFLMLPLLATTISNPRQSWSIDEAFAGDVIATRAVEVTSPPGPIAENAIIAAAQLRPAGSTIHAQRGVELAVLGLTFSLLLACNLALLRQMRRENVGSRRKAGIRK
jgi:hypothetical protein